MCISHTLIWSNDTYVYSYVGTYSTLYVPFSIINVVVIITQPMNATVCLTQSTTATFTCVVDRGGRAIFTANWHILDGASYVPVPDNGRPRHMVSHSIDDEADTLTDTLTVTDVSVIDNGAVYRCQPLIDVTSINATITVLGMYLHNYMCMYIRKYYNCCKHKYTCK